MNNFFLATLLLVSPVMLQAAAIYKWTDEAGNVHYSDSPQTRSAEEVDIKPVPDAEKIEQAKQREAILRKAAEDLQSNRKQREIQQLEAEKERRKQQRKKEQQAQTQEKKKEPREGRSEGYYQKQWQQQLPPQYPVPAPSGR